MSITREQAKDSVGSGWAKLIDRFYDSGAEYQEVADVKEKFGTLRIYLFTDAYDELVEELETKSAITCEFCGEPGTLVSLKGWYKTLCPNCTEEAKRQWLTA